MKPVTCYGIVTTRNSQQEWYDSKSRDAGRRARTLRKAGFEVHVEGMGGQITNVGRCNMTLVSIPLPFGGREIPAPDKIERL